MTSPSADVYEVPGYQNPYVLTLPRGSLVSAVPEEGQPWEAADTGLGWDAMPEMEEAPQEPGGFGMAVDPYGEEADIPPVLPEIHVNLDAEYFRWKDGEGGRGEEGKAFSF